MARGAVVVILSDGWERGDPALVGREMERLARLAHRIVWVNPRVGASSVLGAGRRHGRGAAVLRRARQRPQLRGAGRGGRRDRRRVARRGTCPTAAARDEAAEEETWASATPVAGQLGRDAERARPEQGQHHAGLGHRGGRVSDDKICIYPGCERPAAPAHPQGGPQPAFCDLEEHNALTAHQERQRLASANDNKKEDQEWRTRPTARCSCACTRPARWCSSLTTDADGKESQYAQTVADDLGVPALDVKVVPADTDRFGVGHGFNTAPSDGTTAAISRATAKIRDKGQLLAGMALEAAPETLTWSNGAWTSGDGSDPDQVAHRRGHRAVRARHRRAAARCRGRPRRAGRLHRLSGGQAWRRSRPRPRRRPSARRTAPSTA